ncbi:MAG TPA: LacI family DNA-binding transcriptional regulator [Trebonia sp.]|nr:LacI family DNA-binding transcriptional regulator [Trebonia sp.]
MGYELVTLYDVARHAGVSIATVSRVLHGQGPVRDNTRDRVRSAIDELGYVPDGAAQSLARNRKDVIGLVAVEHMGLKPDQYDIESMSLLFYDAVIRGVELRIREKNWALLINFLREEEDMAQQESVQSRLLALSGKVDGLLIGEGILAPQTLAKLARRLPLVVVAGDTAQRAVDVVSADNWSGAHALVEHLVVDHGRRRLFHIGGPATAPDATERRLAMAAVIEANPGTALTGSYTGLFSVTSGREGTLAMLAAGGELPDALVCANDQMAIGALRTLAERGIRVPDDIAVVGFDDIFPASLCEPPLTTVHQPIRKLAEVACDRLAQRINDPTLRPKQELLPTELVLRSSCGCPPGTMERWEVRHVARRKPTGAAKSGRPLAGTAAVAAEPLTAER